VSPAAITFTGGHFAGADDEQDNFGLQSPSGGRVPSVGPGEVVFATAAPALTLRCKLGATSAKRSGGIGGWQDVERAGRAGGVEWTSTPGFVLEIPLLLDGLAHRVSIEDQVQALYRMGRPASGTPRGTAPPLVAIGGMVPHGGRDWALNGLDEGDAVWDGSNRIRLWLTATFVEYVKLDLVKVRGQTSSTPTTKTHVVRRGETLGSIARDVMGANTAGEIAAGVRKLKALNNLRDPKALKVGQHLKVPR
jgi:hypothetical protein